MKSCIDIKQVYVDQPWTQLAGNGSVVLFCAGLSQPIVPTSPEQLCTRYQRVPPLRDLMATTGHVLDSVLRDNSRGTHGSKLSDKVQWIRENALIQFHKQGQSTPMFHEQMLRVVKRCNLDPSIHASVKRHLSSGFIFTNRRSRNACSDAIVPANCTILRITTENFVHKTKTLPEGPEDDSSSMVSNGSDSGINQRLPTSSISSDESPQIEEQPDMSIRWRLSGTTTTRTWDTADNRRKPPYFDTSSERQVSMTSTPSSGIHRTIKRKGRCMDLASSIAKGKGRASETEGCVLDAAGRNLSDTPRKIIAALQSSGTESLALKEERSNGW
jgi:hypothetical protein